MEKTLEVVRGNTKDYKLVFSDGVGTLKNITSWKVFFTVKRTKESLNVLDSDAVISKTVTEHTDPLKGTTIVSITVADNDIKPGVYFYDIKVITDLNKVLTLSKGKYVVSWRATGRVE